jgi:hypothetical protein
MDIHKPIHPLGTLLRPPTQTEKSSAVLQHLELE